MVLVLLMWWILFLHLTPQECIFGEFKEDGLAKLSFTLQKV